MIRTGQQYLDRSATAARSTSTASASSDVTTHPMFKPLVDIRARIYDMAARGGDTRRVMTYRGRAGERYAVANKLPLHAAGLARPSAARPTRVLDEIGGIVTRVGDETVGEMWSLYDGQDVLERGRSAVLGQHPPPRRRGARKIRSMCRPTPIRRATARSAPQDQDPDMLLHVVKETDAGIIVRGAKYETAAAYANQAFTKPTIANWGNSALSDYAVGFICDLGSPNLKFICRTGFAGRGPVGGLSAVQPLRRGRCAASCSTTC